MLSDASDSASHPGFGRWLLAQLANALCSLDEVLYSHLR